MQTNAALIPAQEVTAPPTPPKTTTYIITDISIYLSTMSITKLSIRDGQHVNTFTVSNHNTHIDRDPCNILTSLTHIYAYIIVM